MKTFHLFNTLEHEQVHQTSVRVAASVSNLLLSGKIQKHKTQTEPEGGGASQKYFTFNYSM